MSYQPATYERSDPARQAVPPAPHHPISKWWPISVGIGAIVLYAIGGGLFGGFNSCDSYYNDCSGWWSGGVALCSLASLASIAWIILLVLYITRRNRPVYWNPTTGFLDGGNFAPQPYQQPQPQPQPLPQPQLNHPMGEPKEGGRFCGQCGNSVETPFCPRCGATVPDA